MDAALADDRAVGTTAPAHAATYGGGSDARLLAGIMGHNLCLDIFGPPSDEEALAGLTAHGEGSVAAYELDVERRARSSRARSFR